MTPIENKGQDLPLWNLSTNGIFSIISSVKKAILSFDQENKQI